MCVCASAHDIISHTAFSDRTSNISTKSLAVCTHALRLEVAESLTASASRRTLMRLSLEILATASLE